MHDFNMSMYDACMPREDREKKKKEDHSSKYESI